MAKLTRYLQKIFANNSDQVGVFGTGVDKETSKNVETLQSADYEEGWSSAIITNKNYPIWQEMDGVQYGLSYQLKYLFQNGMPEWISTETYYTNSYCRVGSNIYYSLQDNNINHNPALNDGWWTPLLTSNRSIGEIVTSTVPLTDAGLHLLDGSWIELNGSYKEFVEYILSLYPSYPNLFTDETGYNNYINTYGVCGKFCYDGVNQRLRLPKITGAIEGTTDVTALSNLVEAGLPNITGNLGWTSLSQDSITNGCFRNNGFHQWYMSTITTSTVGDYAVDFNASRSSSIYGNSSTVQPQAIKVLYYIVIATSTKTNIEVDIDDIATDLNGKSDVDLSNVTNTGYAIMARASMPSSSHIELTLGASGSTYTAPADGWLCLAKQTTDYNQYIQFNATESDLVSKSNFLIGAETYNIGSLVYVFMPMAKGQSTKIYYNVGGNVYAFRFIYAKGSESEAN